MLMDCCLSVSFSFLFLQYWRLADLGVVYGVAVPSRACASKRRADGEAVYVARWAVARGGDACGG
jgi:hypothetical protein